MGESLPAPEFSSLFDEVVLEPGATAAVLDDLQANVFAPLRESEIEEIVEAQTNPWPRNDKYHSQWEPLDPRRWRLPSRPLPKSLLNLLSWSDGLWARTGRREFGFLGAAQLREYLLAYHFPEYMPEVLPIALDGGGVFYCLDMRSEAVDGEYPVLAASSGDLDFESAVLVSDSLVEACAGSQPIADLL